MTNTSYTVTEAARLLKLHPKTVLRKIKSGEIGATQIGRQYRISQAQFEAFAGAAPAADPITATRQISASCVVDIDAISADESSRISNSIMAVMNSGQFGARVDCIYYEEVGKLKIVVHGSIESSQEVLSLINTLVDHHG